MRFTKILESKLPARGNLVRMSRSKVGVVMLISQSPNEFTNEDDDFLNNVGLMLAFNPQAQPGPTRRVFGQTMLLARETPCGIRLEARTRSIAAWK